MPSNYTAGKHAYDLLRAFWEEKLQANRERDRRVTRQLRPIPSSPKSDNLDFE
jgi:hypothetical protein